MNEKNNHKITRIELIDQNGRCFIDTNVTAVDIGLQDEGKTLKIWFKSERHQSEFAKAFHGLVERDYEIIKQNAHKLPYALSVAFMISAMEHMLRTGSFVISNEKLYREALDGLKTFRDKAYLQDSAVQRTPQGELLLEIDKILESFTIAEF